MRMLFLAALAATTMLFMAGCDNAYQSSAPREVGPAVTAKPAPSTQGAPEEYSAMAAPARTQPQNAAAPAPQPNSGGRISTTQQLPAGYEYVNEKELTRFVAPRQ
ncbi:MAG: hypothetical protein LBT97_10770 [Planctomycetota bacterium]|nr:hypothetical protein [Planctomycetota bacterium]